MTWFADLVRELAYGIFLAYFRAKFEAEAALAEASKETITDEDRLRIIRARAAADRLRNSGKARDFVAVDSPPSGGIVNGDRVGSQ